MSKYWIQEAIRHPDALTEWFKRNREKLKRKLGFDPITRKGDINDRAITKTIKLVKEGKLRVSETTLRRLYLARTLKKLRKHKKHKHGKRSHKHRHHKHRRRRRR